MAARVDRVLSGLTLQKHEEGVTTLTWEVGLSAGEKRERQRINAGVPWDVSGFIVIILLPFAAAACSNKSPLLDARTQTDADMRDGQTLGLVWTPPCNHAWALIYHSRQRHTLRPTHHPLSSLEERCARSDSHPPSNSRLRATPPPAHPS